MFYKERASLAPIGSTVLDGVRWFIEFLGHALASERAIRGTSCLTEAPPGIPAGQNWIWCPQNPGRIPS